MTYSPEQLDDEYCARLWQFYDLLVAKLATLDHHPAHDAVHARVKAHRLALAHESPELMHATGVYRQLPWRIAETDGSADELWELLTQTRNPELGP